MPRKRVPRAGIEAESRGVGLVSGRIGSLECGERHRSIREIAANQFHPWCKTAGRARGRADGLVTLAEFPGDRFVHRACQSVRAFVEENFKSMNPLIAYVVAGKCGVCGPSDV